MSGNGLQGLASRFRDDNFGPTVDDGWLGGLNNTIPMAPETRFRLRYLVGKTGGSGIATHDLRFQVRRNVSSWIALTSTSQYARLVESPHYAAGDDSTASLLGTNTIITPNGALINVAPSKTGGILFTTDPNTGVEMEACIQVVGSDVVPGDFVRFRGRVANGNAFSEGTRVNLVVIQEVGTIDGVGFAGPTVESAASVGATVRGAGFAGASVLGSVAARSTVDSSGFGGPTVKGAGAFVPGGG